MRIRTLVLAVGGVVTLAAPAFAQMGNMAPMGPSSVNQNREQYLQEDRSLPQAYVKKVTALSYRTLEIRAEDGGKLTREHAATLQRELDQLQRQYRVRAELRINAG